MLVIFLGLRFGPDVNLVVAGNRSQFSLNL